MAGLLDMYMHCGNPQALDVAAEDGRLGQVPRGPPHRRAAAGRARDRIRRHERGAGRTSMPSPAIRITCAWRARSTTSGSSIRWPRGEDHLNGLHANTQIPEVIGAAREYELTGEQRYHDIAAVLLAARGAAPLLRHRRATATARASSRIDQFSKHLGAVQHRNLQHLQHAQADAPPLLAGAVGRDDGFLRARALQPHPRLAGSRRPA